MTEQLTTLSEAFNSVNKFIKFCELGELFNKTYKYNYYASPEFLASLFIKLKAYHPEFNTLEDLKTIQFKHNNTQCKLYDYIIKEIDDMYNYFILNVSNYNNSVNCDNFIQKYKSKYILFLKINIDDKKLELLKDIYRDNIYDSIGEFFNTNQKYIDKSFKYIDQFHEFNFSYMLKCIEDFFKHSEIL